MASSGWLDTTWGSESDLVYGRSLKGYRESTGLVEVFGTNGAIGWTDAEPMSLGPAAIVGRKGAYRGVHLAKTRFWVIDTAYWLRAGPRMDPIWAYYALLDVDINGMDSGSAIPSLTRDHFRALPLRLPALDEQRRIAGVLGALDDLIDTNKRLALDCERLAQSLASNAREQTPLSSFTTWGGLGTIKPSGLVDHYSLPAFDDGQKPEHVDGSAIKSNKQKLEHPCVLVARLNPHIPRVWMVYPDQSVTSLASTEFVRITGEGIAEEVIYAVCSAPAFLEQMNGLVTGTTGSHQRVDKDALTSVAVPDVRTLPTANLDAITLLVRQAQVCREELRDLANTRDELLPLLLSGAVTVSESAA